MKALKLVNETRWETRDLRRFALAGLRAEVGWWNHYTVAFRTRRRFLGRGYIGSNHMKLYMPVPAVDDDTLSGDNIRDLARTLAHEAMHNKGVSGHRDIDDSNRDLAWADALVNEGFVIHARKQTEKAKVDLRAVRAAKAQKMLAEHESKLRREQKLVRKWRQKVRYYARVKVAAMAPVKITE